MSMKAVIMAGGEGSRLRPITGDLPKPMVPVAGVPVIEHILALLNRHSITEAAVTLQYLPQAITCALGNSCRGVDLAYFTENKPLGTAGSVKNCESFLDGDFIVISGDAMCDIDLTAAIAWHREKNAQVTLILKQVENPLEYGVVLTAPDGKIQRFIEKPSWTEVFADTANTGIYIINREILSHIPEGEAFDFSKDLFPKLLEKSVPLYGYTAKGYWCDIGDIGAYRDANFDALDGKISLSIPIPQSQKKAGFTLLEPSYVSAKASIADGAVIGPYAVIGDAVSIGKNASLSRTIVHDFVKIGDMSSLTGCVLCHGAVIKRGVTAGDGCVVGGGSVIGEHTEIKPGIKVYQGKTVSDNLTLSSNIVTGNASSFDETFAGHIGVELTPESCSKKGAAIASSKPGMLLALMHDGSDSSKLLCDALSLGAASAGAEVLLFGSGFCSLLEFSVRKLGFDFGVFVSDKDGYIQLTLRDRYGLPVPRYQLRKIEGLHSRDDFYRSAKSVVAPAQSGGMDILYRSELLSSAAALFDGMNVFVACNNKQLREALCTVLEKNGAQLAHTAQKGQLHFYLDEKGSALYVKDEQLRPISAAEVGALTLAAISICGGRRVAYPQISPSSFDRICELYGLEYHKYYSCPASECDSLARSVLTKEPAVIDAAAAVIKLLSAVKLKNTTLSKLYDSLPGFHIKTAEVWLPSVRRAYVMRKMQGRAGEAVRQTEGVRINDRGGEIIFLPRGQSSFYLRAEAADAETAEELCTFYKQEIYRIADSTEE